MRINKLTLGIFIAAMSMPMASCQKDNESELFNQSLPETTANVVTYSVNGMVYRVVVNDEKSMKELYDFLLALARSGETVRIFSGNQPQKESMAKDVVVYNTNNENDANRWAREMRDQGYDVEIKFDDKTGIYTCTAIRN